MYVIRKINAYNNEVILRAVVVVVALVKIIYFPQR